MKQLLAPCTAFCAFMLLGSLAANSATHSIHSGGLPYRVHVFEDYETEIEARWWLRGVPETNNVAPSLSSSRPNRRASRATLSKNFDRKMEDQALSYNAVIFNPVPGPPMGSNTRLAFRYWLAGTNTLRVQIYSLSRGYHRYLMLTNLTQNVWSSAAVDMTLARRPDGSGGPLSEHERIDDIQFYVSPETELLIDDIVLYDAAPPAEKEPMPGRIMFTGWFDTGRQGEGHEWPGDFEIVPHEPPLSWDAAKAVEDPETGESHIRVGLRGQRPLSQSTRLRYRYHTTANDIQVILANANTGQEWTNHLSATKAVWAQATHDLDIGGNSASASELRFVIPRGNELRVDDVLLYEPGEARHTADLSTDALHVRVADNEPYPPHHRGGYSGVSELAPANNPAANLFVPFYAGLNFEHIFNGDSGSYDWNIFEPRRVPTWLVRVSPKRVELFQERTEHWPLRSRISYQTEGDAIDFTYCGTPLQDVWGKHGYVGIFFASYIHAPEDMSIEFIGRSRVGRGNTEARWIRHIPPSHGVASNHRPAGSNWDPSFDDGFNIALAEGISDLEYLHPFYLGRSGDFMLLMMFERPAAGGEVRFAQSPSGGGKGNPAWDFIFYQREYAVNKEFCFRGRAVYRRFADREDVVRIYEEWSGETVERPR